MSGPMRGGETTPAPSAREADGIELRLHHGVFAVDDPGAVRTGDGRPYTVFTPYHRTW